MKDAIIVKRYGDAFISLAKDTSGREKALEDVKNLKSIIRQNPDFIIFLESPAITLAEKNEFMDMLLRADFSIEFRNFLKLLLVKGRIDKLARIAEYVRATCSSENEVGALLKTAFPLDLDLIELVKKKLENRYQKKIKLYIDLDGSLLGGIQVVIGNTVIDGSLRRRLDELRGKLEMAR